MEDDKKETKDTKDTKLSKDTMDTKDNRRDPFESLVEDVLLIILSMLDTCDLYSCMRVATHWESYLRDGNGIIWRRLCNRLMPEAKCSELLSVLPTFKDKLRARAHGWNRRDCSAYLYVQPGHCKLFRIPMNNSTDGVRTKIGYSSGRHAWNIVWQGHYDSTAQVGIATKAALKHICYYIDLMGHDGNSWAWNLNTDVLSHYGWKRATYACQRNRNWSRLSNPGDVIRMVLNCEDGTLSFFVNNTPLGVAFNGLRLNKLLYPMICTAFGENEISIVYLGEPPEEPPSTATSS